MQSEQRKSLGSVQRLFEDQDEYRDKDISTYCGAFGAYFAFWSIPALKQNIAKLITQSVSR